MTQPFSKIVSVMLLGAMVIAGAGGACVLPASAVAHLETAGCHPVKVPFNPKPDGYRCCAIRHSSALMTVIFSPGLTLREVRTGAVRALVLPGNGDVLPTTFAASAGPPGVLILRI